MHSVLVYESFSKTDTTPVFWFRGTYSLNIIPFPVIYSAIEYLSPLGETIVEANTHYVRFVLEDIVRIEKSMDKVLVFMINGAYWTSKTQFELIGEKANNQQFIKVHENHLINLQHLDKIVKCEAFVVLSNTEAIPVDSQNSKTVFNFLENRKILY